MSFFLVDDGFAMHEKVRQLLECDRLDKHGSRFVAISLWTLAGSFCSRKPRGKSDGVITVTQAKMVLNCDLKTAKKACERLVEVGLWVRHGDAYRFHEWENWQRPRPKNVQTEEPAEELGQTSDDARTECGQRADDAMTTRGQRTDNARTDLGHGSSIVSNTSEPSSRARDPLPLPLPSHSQEREKSAPARGETEVGPIAPPISESDPLFHPRWYLIGGFRRRWEASRGLQWPGHGYDPDPTEPAKWLVDACERHGVKFEAAADDILDRWFAEDWPRKRQYPWRTFAKQISNYVPDVPRAEVAE